MNEFEKLREKYNIKLPCKGYLFVKRVMDIVCSAFALIVLSPILLITALAIKLESPGPAVFVQKRVGVNGKEFNMYKFRSMCMDAEEKLKKIQHKNETEGPTFKMQEDPRITKVGHFIRKYSIDELLQLVNILKGDMSIIGPRPALPREVAQYGEFDKLRLLVKPGLSCYWQISGRSDIPFDEWMKLDTEAFLAIGVDELSVTPSAILPIRKKVIETNVSEIKESVLDKYLN